MPRQERDKEAPLTQPAGKSDLQVLRALGTGLGGLDERQAELRLVEHGENVLPVPPSPSFAGRVAAQARDPYAATLCLLIAVTCLSGAFRSAAVLSALVVAGVALRLVGERRAEQDAAALRGLAEGTATVLRRRVAADGGPDRAHARELPFDQFVPGDLVRLAPGDRVPADLVLVRSSGLTLDQSALTGVSLPVVKHAAGVSTAAASGLHTPDNARVCLRGCTVVHGTGTGVVVATGADTHLAGRPASTTLPGHPGAFDVAAQPDEPSPRRTAFDRTARAVSGLLLRLTLLSGAAGLLVGALAEGHSWEVVPYAAAVAVGLTPEMLLLVVTAALARQSDLLRRGGVYARRLTAVHDLGTLDVLCTDKTGTLTRDRLVLDAGLDPEGHPDPAPAHWAAVTSLVCTDLGDPPLVDSVDEALLDAAWAADPDFADRLTGVFAVPFEPSRRIAVAVVHGPVGLGARTISVTGAVEDVLARCAGERVAGRERTLTQERRDAIVVLADARAADGLRVLAVATAETDVPVAGPGARAARRRAEDPYGLTLLGLACLADATEPDAAAALGDLAAAGLAVKIVTGDRAGAAALVCRAAGLEPGTPLLGPQADTMDDAELRRTAERTTVFALFTPAQKARLVRALQASGHTVGFLGDGLNDLPALHAADVGVSSPAALDPGPRRSADLVLGADALRHLAGALRAARTAVANVGNYLRITLASNLGNVLAMLAAGAAVPFLPMLPAQVLAQNLCFDVAQLALAFDRPLRDGAATAAPRRLTRAHLARYALFFGAVNACADVATFAVLRFLSAGLDASHAEVLFHSGWFTENLITQAVTVHLLRTSARRTRAWAPAARPVRVANLGLVVTGILLPATPLGASLGLRLLPGEFYALLAVILAAYAAALLAGRRFVAAFRAAAVR
ncbi:HAD-IC family P-type ATPase [Streptacidiphilus melanogenes]|uniref:HAD-IC family P-type ATPase n=1 Tax=Streptacidiphilus melanogenes TaxID=411235 RepID=UPI0006934890|nr:HAD-IC family P-type ATPase [Streptacidiphilus melanogenes]